MVRKSKQASGNATLTHYERRHKLTADHGTLERRLAGHAQYQLGDCGLSLTALSDKSRVLCSPSGYLYEDQAILEYLITQTQEIKEKMNKEAVERATKESAVKDEEEVTRAKRKAAFDSSQQWMKKNKSSTSSNDASSIIVDTEAAKTDLRRTSYWLAEAQPVLTESQSTKVASTRPLSPHSQQPLRRKDLWPVQLEFEKSASSTAASSSHDKSLVLCSLTGKPIRTQAAVAYWTTNRCTEEPGQVVLQEEGFEQLIVKGGVSTKDSTKTDGKPSKKKPDKKQVLYCPRTNLRIKHTRVLQRSGSSFATSGQATVVQTYRPTMT